MAQQGTWKWKRIGWLMLAGELLLLLFLAQWLRSQYQLQERRLHQDIKTLYTRTEQRLTDSILNQVIAVVLESPETGSTKMQMHIKGRFKSDSLYIRGESFSSREDTLGPHITMQQTWQVDTQFSGVRNISIRPSKGQEPAPGEVQKVLRIALSKTDSILNHVIAAVIDSTGSKPHRLQMQIKRSFNTDSTITRNSLSGKSDVPGPQRISLVQNTQIDTLNSGTRKSITRSLRNDGPMPAEIQKALRFALVQTARAKELYDEAFPTAADSILLVREFGKELEKKQKGFVVAGWDTLAADSTRLFRYAYNNGSNIIVGGYQPYLLSSLFPEIGFSLLLLLLIGLAFALAYRVMKQQAMFNRQKDSFISNISHELKTPVATTKVAIEALTTYNGLENPERTRKYLKVASWEMDRLSTLIDRIMNIIQTENGNLLLDKKPVLLAALAEEIIATQQPILQEKGITIQWEHRDDTLAVPADSMHLQGVLYNLLDNAVKYGGNLITIDVGKIGNNARLAIGDNGPGIRPEYQKKVFDSFFRVPSDNRHDVKGHGLGLSYARDIIEGHQGSISLESTPGKGAVFIITLPLHPSL